MVEGFDTHEDVDNRLSGQTGDGSTSDVMDPADGPGANAFLQGRTLSLELHRPARIIDSDADGFVFL
jgi:hypothetical protein